LPDVDLPVHAGVGGGGHYFASLEDASQVFASVPQSEIEATDWWWILYPSHVPEQYPAFQHAEFITGGMGTGAEGFSPFFIIDDRWIVRKPPHIGTGEYSDVERSVTCHSGSSTVLPPVPPPIGSVSRPLHSCRPQHVAAGFRRAL
jgi:hypothetical protein